MPEQYWVLDQDEICSQMCDNCWVSPGKQVYCSDIQVVEESRLPLSDVMKEAEDIVNEMAHTFRLGVIRGFAVVLVKVMKQLFQRIYVNEEGIQKVNGACLVNTLPWVVIIILSCSII